MQVNGVPVARLTVGQTGTFAVSFGLTNMTRLQAALLARTCAELVLGCWRREWNCIPTFSSCY